MRKKRDKHGNKIAERRAAAVQRTQAAVTETEVLRITGSQPQSSEADIEVGHCAERQLLQYL